MNCGSHMSIEFWVPWKFTSNVQLYNVVGTRPYSGQESSDVNRFLFGRPIYK